MIQLSGYVPLSALVSSPPQNEEAVKDWVLPKMSNLSETRPTWEKKRVMCRIQFLFRNPAHCTKSRTWLLPSLSRSFKGSFFFFPSSFQLREEATSSFQWAWGFWRKHIIKPWVGGFLRGGKSSVWTANTGPTGCVLHQWLLHGWPECPLLIREQMPDRWQHFSTWLITVCYYPVPWHYAI